VKSIYIKILFKEEEIRQMWKFHPEINPYHLGSYAFNIERKDLIKFIDRLELLANFEIIDNLELNGNGSMNSSGWESLNFVLTNDFEMTINQRA